MVQFGEDLHLFLDCLQVILQFLFIHNFDGYLVVWVWYVVGKEYFAECTLAKNLCVVVYQVIQFQFFCTHFLRAF